ncbi:hypothetical protein DPX16_14685 [Anabarilius grahami]|uniref:Uncharacterized protein n=1 Tax=Anabarilius grahami TaxID=495550 RepID=A0A3N0XNY7_ANAGA|nr:hypothetical protein DPX16_14685 [Anabarilius grahami]
MEPEPEQPPKALFVPEPALKLETEQVQEPVPPSGCSRRVREQGVEPRPYSFH